jgi:cytochrome c peroxidase
VHYASSGLDSPFKSSRLKGFEATPRDISDLVAFLRSLTDDEFLKNPEFGPPR